MNAQPPASTTTSDKSTTTHKAAAASEATSTASRSSEAIGTAISNRNVEIGVRIASADDSKASDPNAPSEKGFGCTGQ